MEILRPSQIYNAYEELKKACLEKPDQIVLGKDVLSDANALYGKIKKKRDLLSVIVNDELENLRFHKKVGHLRFIGIDIYVYYFERKSITGYIAFFNYQGKWTIKSFKINDIQLGEISKSQPMLKVLKELKLPKNFKFGEPI